MLHIITTNDFPCKNIEFDPGKNFIIVHSYNVPMNVSTIISDRIIYDIYYQEEMNTTQIFEEYQSSNEMEFNLYPMDSVLETMNSICNCLLDYLPEDTGDDLDDFKVFVANEPQRNNQIIKYLSNHFSELNQLLDTPLDIESLTKSYKRTSLADLTKLVKSTIGSDMVYPEDPISFSYAVRLMF